MAELKINYSELKTAIQLSKDINKELDQSYQTVHQLKSYIASASWSGLTKEAFVAYLDLISQYHTDLIEIMKEHEEAVEKLKKLVDDYNHSAEVSTIKGL